MKQSNKYARYLGRLVAHEASKKALPPQYEHGMDKNIAGCSLHRVDKSRGYENDVFGLIRQLRWKHIVVNDSHATETIDVNQNYTVEVAPKSIYVGLGKEIGNKTRGKLDFLKSQGFTIFGWNDIR